MPLISVIVPVYKVEPYLRRCVDSILAQTFTDFELILVDDGSPDNCGAICDEYAVKDSRIIVFHQENKGQAAARNLALDWLLANSDSEYISFVDSDDWVHPRYLELLRLALQRCGTSMSQCRHIVTESWVDHENVADEKMLCVTPEEQYVNWYSAFFWGKLFHKSCFLSVRFPEGKIFEDVLIWYKLLFQFDKVAIVDAELYYYYQRPDNTMNGTWTPAKLAQVDAWEEQLAFALHHGSKPVLQTALKRYCWVYKHQCEEIAVSNRISEKERKEYRSRLLRRFRLLLLRHRKELKEIGIFSQYTAWAFPKADRLYWIVRGIWRKLKRLLSL